MRFPSINRQPMHTIRVPQMAGGINLRDGVSSVGDNQMTDSLNMWYNDGMLKTRPGIKYDEAQTVFVQDSAAGEVVGALTRSETIFYNGCEFAVSAVDVIDSEGKKNKVLYFKAISHTSGDGTESIPELFLEENTNYIPICFKNEVYVIFHKNESLKRGVYTLKNGIWELVPEKEIYAPLIMTNGISHIGEGDDVPLYEGTMVEGYNLLTPYYKMVYSNVNRERLDASNPNDSHLAIYPLISSPLAGYEIIVKITSRKHGTVTHTITKPENPNYENGYWYYGEDEVGEDGYAVRGCQDKISLFVKGEGSELSDYITQAYLTADDFILNSIEITASRAIQLPEISKAFDMTKSIWFGGVAEGLSGGTRLFLGGNINKNEQALVIWSDANNPLYFSENNYFYVGNTGSPVTAMAKQADMMVIFKEKEMYYTTYNKAEAYTAEELMNQSVVDVAAAAAVFPLVQINSAVGCDCPNTMQLCRNRLVWACSDGRVYVLVSNSQYNERNVYEIGEMVRRRLKGEKELKAAVSCDWDGRYMLFCNHGNGESGMYAMDYNSYGYQYVHSYSKDEDANFKIPWFYGELPIQPQQAFVAGERMYLPNIKSNILLDGDSSEGRLVRRIIYHYMDGDACKDEDAVINSATGQAEKKLVKVESIVQTKLFDFGSSAYSKAVPFVNITFGNNGGEPIGVSFITESGEYRENDVYITESDSPQYSPDFTHNRRFTPAVRPLVKIGAKIRCKGAMAIESLSISYRILGGVS